MARIPKQMLNFIVKNILTGFKTIIKFDSQLEYLRLISKINDVSFIKRPSLVGKYCHCT